MNTPFDPGSNPAVVRPHVVPPLAEPEQEDAHDPMPDLDSVIRFIGSDLVADGALLAVDDGGPADPQVLSAWGLPLGLKVLDGVAGGGAIGHSLADGMAIARRLKPESASNGTRITVALAAPVRSPKGVTGALCVGFAHPLEADGGRKLNTLTAYAALMGLWLENSETLVQFLRAAYEDGLTGCLTYAALAQQLESEVSRSQRTGQPLSCLFIDVDGFKQVNDDVGHVAGNHVLSRVATTLKARVRATDTVGRFGGDEFVVLLPDTDGFGGVAVGAALAEAVRDASADVYGGPVEISVGVSELCAGMTPTELIDHADNSMRGRRGRFGSRPRRGPQLR